MAKAKAKDAEPQAAPPTTVVVEVTPASFTVQNAPAGKATGQPATVLIKSVDGLVIAVSGREIPKPDSTFYWCQNVAGDCPGTGDAPVKKFE